MTFDDLNDGLRPSRLELARYSAGELDYGATARIEAWLVEHPEDLAYLAELEASRHDVAPFDAEALRARADRPTPSAIPDPEPVVEIANDNSAWMMIAAGAIAFAAVAAVAVTALVYQAPPPSVPTPEAGGIKGLADMDVYALDADEKLRPYGGDALGAGDVLGFQVKGGGWSEVVVLSVDGAGTVSVYYPSDGDDPHALGDAYAMAPLPGTVILDGAPGPEVFVAVFGQSVGEATATIIGQAEGGPDALVDWAERTSWADAVIVERVAP